MICTIARLGVLVFYLAHFGGRMEAVSSREDDGLGVRISILASVILINCWIGLGILGDERPCVDFGRLVGDRGPVMLIRIAAWPLQGSSRLRGGGPDSILRIHDI
jgi:hypothetical protein